MSIKARKQEDHGMIAIEQQEDHGMIAIEQIIADPQLEDDGTPEGRFYEAADQKRTILEQMDAVTVLLHPDMAPHFGLQGIDAIWIARTIDPELFDIHTEQGLMDALRAKVEALEQEAEVALQAMRNYPEDVKADIYPDLKEHYEDLDETIKGTWMERQSEIEQFGKPLLATSKALLEHERMLNDVYALMIAHQPAG